MELKTFEEHHKNVHHRGGNAHDSDEEEEGHGHHGHGG